MVDMGWAVRRVVAEMAEGKSVVSRFALHSGLRQTGSAFGAVVYGPTEEGGEKVDLWRMKRRPGAKALVFAGFFAGLKPCAPTEERQFFSTL